MQPFLLNTEGDPKNQPDKSSRLNINVNLTSELGSVVTEDGNNPLHLYPTEETYSAVTIGKIPLLDGKTVIFSCVPKDSSINGITRRLVNGEIGVLSVDGSYRVLLRDNYPDPDTGNVVDFGWDLNTQIQGTYKINFDNTITVYFVDNKNPIRCLNIDNPNINTDNFYRIISTVEFNKLNVLTPFTNNIINLQEINTGGNLPSGVYYVIAAYSDENFNETNTLFPSNPISIIDENFLSNVDQYDGCVANTPTSKSFTISISNVETTFSYFKIYVVAKINGVFTVYDYDFHAITGSTFSLSIPTLSNKPTSSLDVLVNKINWIAKTITQIDSQLYIANLKEKERTSLQPWINNIVVNADISEVGNVNNNDDFHNEKTIYTDRVFQYDEVYALYATVSYVDGSESEAYHIPGRSSASIDLPTSVATLKSTTETARIADFGVPYDIWTYNGGGPADTSPGGEMYNIDNNSQTFHAFDTSYNPFANTNLGYWENQNEFYPNTSDWDILDSDGTGLGTNRGTHVRHHKMPNPQYLQTNGNNTSEYKRLGLVFSNIRLPQELEDEIVAINFYYAKRTNENRLVFGQSLLLNDVLLVKASDNLPFQDSLGQWSNDTVYSLGTTLAINNFGGSGSTSGGFPLAKKLILSEDRFKAAPFDAISQLTNPSSISYLKPIKALKMKLYNYDSSGYLWSNTGDLNYVVKAYWDVDDANAEITHLINPSIALRRTKPCLTIENIPDNAFTGGVPLADFTLKTNHYKSDKHIILETENILKTSDLYPNGVVTYTFSYLPPPFDVDNRLFETSGSAGTLSNEYNDLVVCNLYNYKTDVYNSFDFQELAFTNNSIPLTSDAFDGTGQSTSVIYGGDTFVGWSGYRGTSDIVNALNFDTTGNTAGEWRVLHKYLAETINNINYRHEGPNQYDIYYPKTDIQPVLNVPLLPNGFGNYYGYNTDYTSVNDLRQPNIHSKNFIPTINSFPTRIARSSKDNPESVIDNYRIFLANEYTDIEKSKGEIINITNYNNRLIIQHENSIKATATRDRIKTDDSEAFIGAGDLFDYPPKDLILTDSGYGGLHHQFASVLTQYGIFYPDINTNKIMLLSDGLKNISDEGLSIFFMKNIKLNFETFYKNLIFSLTPTWTAGTYVIGQVRKYNNSLWNCLNTTTDVPNFASNDWEILYSYDNFKFNGKDSIYYGYIAGFDNYYKRYLLTKKDLTVTNTFTSQFKGQYDKEEIDNNWSIGNLFIYQNQLYKITSTLLPDGIDLGGGHYAIGVYFDDKTYFVQERYTIGYYPDYKGWASYYNFYPDNYAVNNTQLFWTKDNVMFEHNKDILLIPDNNGPVPSIIEPVFNNPEPVRLLSTQWKTKALDTNSNEEVLTTFDTVQAYDSYQLSKENAIDNTVNARNLEGYWSCNDFRDNTNDNNLKVVDNNLWYRPFTNNLNLNKHWTKIKKLVDYWFGVRFKYLTHIEEEDILDNVSGFSVTEDYSTYTTADLATSETINVNDILKLTTNSYTVYVKVISLVTGITYRVKLYQPIAFNGDFEFTSINKITKKPKLYLLDVTKLVIKNIR
jgi:hypothetical protein